MNMSLDPMTPPTRSNAPLALGRLAPLVLVLATGSTGCFRATGLARPSVAVEEIPVSGGDRVAGLKATAGPGDFFLGNDSVQMAVDSAVFGDREGQFGAPSGGAVIDVGSISLDQSFKRVSMPTDMLERLGPVANQDPDLPLVFDHYLPSTGNNSVALEMRGYLVDPKGKLGAATDGQGRVAGVSVVHRISLNKGETFFTLETTLTNNGGALLPIRNVGDYLSQHGGGFRFVVPAISTFALAPLDTWGVEIPGSDFTAPLTSSVVAPMVGLMGAEPAGNTLDSHASLGIMPLDVDTLLVASDPQHALTEKRPSFPQRLVVGSPVDPAVTGLQAGMSVSYRRRLYVVGGRSYEAQLPSQTTTVFSQMAKDRGGLRGEDVGLLAFSAFGTAALGGPLQTEFRFERYTYVGPNPEDPSHLYDQANWRLERVEWGEPTEVSSGTGVVGMLVPVVPNAATGVSQRYRLSARNSTQQSFLYEGTNALDTTRPLLRTAITPSKDQIWKVTEALSPERSNVGASAVIDATGNVIRQLQTGHVFFVRPAGTLEYASLFPIRMTFVNQDHNLPDPNVQRARRLSSVFSEVIKAKAIVGANFGGYHYTAGNQVFGGAFGVTASSAGMYFTPGTYLAYAARGPLSYLDSLPIKAFTGQTDTSHGFVVLPAPLPAGWTSFDVPGPTQATTGGLNPGEMLSSAVAEGVQVVARTEEDVLTDATALQLEFRVEIDTTAVTDAQRAPIGNDPFVVGARSSSLADGFTTALFTPIPTTDRNGGARPSKGWTLADFITQAEGGFTIVHRPRGPNGLFTLRGFNPTVPLGSGANAWWNLTGPVSLGKHQGDFDALELLRAEGCDPADPSLWFAEFKSVRADWFALLNQQMPGAFTKALGLSSARFSLDTPVGLARTYLQVGSTVLTQSALDPVLTALRNGAAVASTGPMLDVSINNVGPGGLVTGAGSTVTLKISLYAPDWLPIDEVRVVVNGAAPILVPMASFSATATDFRLRTATVTVPMPAGKDAWVVVEAGVPLNTTGAYLPDTPWNKIMKGIYPIAVTNPIFVDVNGGGYTPPGL